MKILKFHFLIVLICLVTTNLKSQDFLLQASDNYSGVSGIYLQPASIVDSRLKIDVTVFGASLNLNSNFIYLDRSNLFKFSSIKDNVQKNLDGNQKYIFQDAQFQALNFIISTNPNWAVGFTARAREYINAENFSEDLAQFGYDAVINHTYSFNNISNIGNIFYNQNPRASITSWMEYGLTGAAVLLNNNNHFLKAGLTVRYLQGISATYIEAFIDQIKVYSPDSVGTLGENFYLNYGTAGNINSLKKSSESFNVGFDFGFVYEWRPNYNSYLYDMTGNGLTERRDLNKYKIKIGFSIVDIGSIKYKKAAGSQNFYINSNFSLSIFDNVKTLENLNGVIDSLVSLNPNDPYYGIFTSSDHDEYFKMVLPTALSFQIDYNIWKNFYLNFTPYIALVQGDNTISKVHALTTLSLTPRYESRHFGFSVPFQYVQTKNLLVGLGIHLGPVWMGSNNLFGVLFNQEIDKLNFYVSFKVPIVHVNPQK